MRSVLWVTAALAVLILIYAVWFRPWLLRRRADGNAIDRFFDRAEAIEIALWRKSETILVSRATVVVGAVLTFATQFKEIDLSPWIPFVPERYQPYVNFAVNMTPALISVLGFVMEKLRRDTTMPVEFVELPKAVVESNPELAAKVEQAAAVKVEVLAEVKQAVEAGEV